LLYVEQRSAANQRTPGPRYSYVLFDHTRPQFEPLRVVGTAIAWDRAGLRLLLVQPEGGGQVVLGWPMLESGQFEVELVLSEQEASMGPCALSPEGHTLLRGDSPLVSLCNQVDTYQIAISPALRAVPVSGPHGQQTGAHLYTQSRTVQVSCPITSAQLLERGHRVRHEQKHGLHEERASRGESRVAFYVEQVGSRVAGFALESRNA